MADYSGVIIPVDTKNRKTLSFASILDGTTNTLAVGEQNNFKTVIAADGSRTTFDDVPATSMVVHGQAVEGMQTLSHQATLQTRTA